MIQELALNTAEALTDYGREWARELAQHGDALTIVVLIGDLGAGKTTLMKGMAEGWGVASAAEVTSPTYTLIHEYRNGGRSLYHLDLYRIESHPQLETLGLDDVFTLPSSAEQRLVAIEWGERVEASLPRPYYRLAISVGGDETRHIQRDRVLSISGRQTKPARSQTR